MIKSFSAMPGKWCVLNESEQLLLSLLFLLLTLPAQDKEIRKRSPWKPTQMTQEKERECFH